MLTVFGMIIAMLGCSLLIYAKKKPSEILFVQVFENVGGVLLVAVGLVTANASNPDHSIETYATILLFSSPLIAGGLALLDAISHSNRSDEDENDEKRKRQPADWEPKKKKRGGVGVS